MDKKPEKEKKKLIASFKDEYGHIDLKLEEVGKYELKKSGYLGTKQFFVHWENAEKVVLDKKFHDFIKAQTYFDKIVLNYMLKYTALKQTPVPIKPVKKVEMEIKDLISTMQQANKNRSFNLVTYMEILDDILKTLKRTRKEVE